jgi:hypothetical protein
MSKYHVNSKTGDSGLCRAEKDQCPFGGESNHYETPELARAAFERTQGGSFLQKSRGLAKRMLVFGGLAVAGVSLAGCATNIATGMDENGEVVTPYDSSASQPLETSEPGIIEKADEFVKDNPINTPSNEEIERWLDEKSGQLGDWLDKQNPSVNPPITYETDGIYFQGRSLEATPEEIAEAQRMLETLVVQPANDDGGYNRDEQFGKGFRTGMAGAVEHRDVPSATFRNDTPQARVVSGTFIDPYTGLPVQVTGGDSYDADIDHIVPLKEAYVSGANSWSNETRKDFANDMDNLVYTASGVNRSKSDKDAANWIPSYEPSQCIYAVKSIEIKGNYKLSVDSAEKAALQNLINTKCVQ